MNWQARAYEEYINLSPHFYPGYDEEALRRMNALDVQEECNEAGYHLILDELGKFLELQVG